MSGAAAQRARARRRDRRRAAGRRRRGHRRPALPRRPAPVLAVTAEHARPGGAGLAAALVAGRGCPVRLVTALEADEAGNRLRGLLDGALTLVTGPATGGTVVKCRWRTGGRSLLRTDRGAGRPAPGFGDGDRRRAGPRARRRRRGAGVGLRPRRRGGPGGARRARPGRAAPGARGVGPASARRRRRFRASRSSRPTSARPAAPPASTRPAPGWARRSRSARELVERWDVRAVAVTLGARGAVVRHRHGACAAAPAPAVRGDRPVRGGRPLRRRGRRPARRRRDRRRGGGRCGRRRGRVRGARRGSRGAPGRRRVVPARRRAVTGRPTPVTDLDAARALVARVRSAGGTVVATGGVFDPLHRGHTDSLAAARALGDCLLVLVNSDGSARRRTGPASAPLAERVAALAALDGVDGVVPFEADDPRAVLDALRPDLWVEGRRPRPGRPARDPAGALVGRRGRRGAVPRGGRRPRRRCCRGLIGPSVAADARRRAGSRRRSARRDVAGAVDDVARASASGRSRPADRGGRRQDLLDADREQRRVRLVGEPGAAPAGRVGERDVRSLGAAAPTARGRRGRTAPRTACRRPTRGGRCRCPR